MKRLLIALLAVAGITYGCGEKKDVPGNVVTTDIDNFWYAYDRIVQEPDSLMQIRLIDSLYIRKGTVGLQKIMEVREYTAQEYVDLINRYPKFFNSLRANTNKAQSLAADLNAGVEKLRAIYPKLRPARIYFTIGAMRTNGTTRDSLVLIGSELAMADSTTDISEFEGETKEWLQGVFSSNPINGLVLLNVHEYVHTQQKPIPDNLRHIVLYEGVAEFVSVTAMGIPSNAPAIEFGKRTAAVREQFEKEMFYERTYEWLWSNAPNNFGVRDLGYYIGYAIAEQHYQNSADKQQAIAQLIELDYSNAEAVDAFIDQTHFFSKPIADLRAEDSRHRPSVAGIQQFENGSTTVDPKTQQLTFRFSEKLNGYNTGVNYSDEGESTFPEVTDRVWAADSAAWTMHVKLEPGRHYKFWITGNFRTSDGIPLLPYLVEFSTRKE